MTNGATALQLAPESALADPSVEYNLDGFPAEQYNRLVPTQTIRVPSDLVVPIVQVVALNPDPRKGDVYSSADIGGGNVALTRVGLRKVATAAAVSIVDVQRTDDGTAPGVCEVKAVAEMVLPSGQRIRAVGTKRIVMDDQKWASPAQRAKFQSALQEHTAARAENRAIRALLSLRGSYPEAEIRKPFAVVTFAPNMNHPEVRAQVIAAMTGTVASAYGPAPKQVGPSAEAQVPLLVAPQAADDDEATEVVVRTNGHARVVQDTGEIVDEEPDWFDDGETPDLTPSQLVGALRDELADGGASKEPATAAQKDALKSVLAGLKAAQVMAVLAAAFDLRDMKAVTASQAQAVLDVAQGAGPAALRETWAVLAEELGR